MQIRRGRHARGALRGHRLRGRFEAMEARQMLAADVIISEFMASNSETLTDEDGDSSDWIELHNRGDESANLDGWYLTDDPTQLDRWALPAVELPSGNFLLVRASGKDRDQAGAQLHANFRLSADGEYLALTRDDSPHDPTDALTIVSEFEPQFPQQLEDVSFGIDQNVSVEPLMPADSATRFFFPTDDALGTSWTQPDFNDQAWTAASGTGVGYESNVPGFTVQDVKSTVSLSSISGALSALDGSNVQSETIATTPVVNFWDSQGGGGVGNFGDTRSFPNDSGGNDDDFAIRATGMIVIPTSGTWTFGINSDDGARLRVGGSTVINDDSLHAPENNFGRVNLTAGAHEIELIFFERGGGAEVELFAANGSYSSFNAGAFRLIGDTADGGLPVVTQPDGSTGGSGVFGGAIQTDVSEAMKGVTSSVYMRTPFFVADADQLESLTLRARYDDGFVAYLNGTEIARRNAPDNLTFESLARSDRSTEQAALIENIDLSGETQWLRDGVNVLAIHALNDTIDSDEFLMSVDLVQLEVSSGELLYFPDPTPGQFNQTEGVEDFLLDEITFSQPHGFYDDPITVEIDALTEGTSVRYTLDGSEPTSNNGTVYDPNQALVIDQTTTLRARALKQGLSPSNVATTTYLFLDDIVQQPTSPPAHFPDDTSINGQQLDYGMDPEIVESATWGPQMEDALKQVPTISIVMDIDDLLGRSRGIYTHAGNHGRAWERPTSVELIHPDGSEGFQVNAGIRIRGGFSRSGSNPKHAFRLFFRDEYGPGKLRFPLFGDEGVDEFDAVDLRTTQNYSWAFQGSSNNAFVRDVFSRDLQREMGQPYTRSRFYHLYINGHYWGLFQTQERSEADYAASYFGGQEEDYDVIKSAGSSGGYQNEATDGNMQAYRRLADFFYQNGGLGDQNSEDYWRVQGMNPDGTRNAGFERLLDVENLIDYMIITYYTGDRDGPGSRFTSPRVNNYFAIFNREEPDGFKFFEHDSEHSLDTGENDMVNPLTTGGSQFRYFNPHWMHEQLANSNSEYRTRFADRVYHHFFAEDGPLKVDNALALIESRAAEFDQAIIAESARWGDADRSTPRTKTDWVRAVNRAKSFIRNRIPTVLQQLEGRDWYPDAAQPVRYSINGTLTDGGPTEPTDEVRMISEAATVFDTIVPRQSVWRFLDDGSDQGMAWRAPDFDDSSWDSGRAELGYGDGNENTQVDCGPDGSNCGSNKYITTYFRKSFTVDNPQPYQSLRVRLRRDDGAAVYLNGEEVVRSNLDDEAAFDDFAVSVVGGGEESTFFDFEIPVNALRTGENVLAVEVHQQNLGSSDISFDLELEGGRLQTGDTPIYFTTDGSDPRMPGGDIRPSAVQYSGQPLAFDRTTVVRARSRVGSQWSPISEAQFLVDQPADTTNLRVTEINYHPHDALLEFGELDLDQDEFEFIELMNIGGSRIDLTDVQFVQAAAADQPDGEPEGIAFTFGVQTLEPGERIVVAKNREAFASRYGNGIRLADARNGDAGTGVFQGSLRNSGEWLTLLDRTGERIQQFEFNDGGGWPGRADGEASSLEVVDVNGDYEGPGNFRNSVEFGGSPGMAGTPQTAMVVFNELLTHTDLPQIDTVELYNATNSAVDLSNWYVSDGADDYFRYAIPQGTTIAADGYLVLTEDEFGFGFRGETSDDAWLIEADGDGQPVRFADHAEFGATVNGRSIGRWPNGRGNLFPMTGSSFGAPNPGPVHSPVLISEVMYEPSGTDNNPGVEAGDLEFIEIWNSSDTPADISHWRLDDAVEFELPAATRLLAGSRLALVAFDPAGDPDKLAAFNQVYGVGADVTLMGPYRGQLDNGGETLRLERPENPQQLGIGYVLVDQLEYDERTPWPNVAANGLSLHRSAPLTYGDFASNWFAAQPTPGVDDDTDPDGRPGDFNDDGQVEYADIELLCQQMGAADFDSTFDLNHDSVVTNDDLVFLIEQILNTAVGDANLDGRFDSTDLIVVFQAGEYEDNIAGNSTWISGDWNCDREFNTTDLVSAFARGGYTSAVRIAARSSASSEGEHAQHRSIARPKLTDVALATDALFQQAFHDSNPLQNIAGSQSDYDRTTTSPQRAAELSLPVVERLFG